MQKAVKAWKEGSAYQVAALKGKRGKTTQTTNRWSEMACQETRATPSFHSPDGDRNFLFLRKIPPYFFFFSLGFSLKCVQGVTAPEHVVPMVLQSMWSFTQNFSSCCTHCPMGIQPGAFGTQWPSAPPAPAVPPILHLPTVLSFSCWGREGLGHREHGLALGSAAWQTGKCEGTFQLTVAGEVALSRCVREGGQARKVLRNSHSRHRRECKIKVQRCRWTSGICRSGRSCANVSYLSHPGARVSFQSEDTELPSSFTHEMWNSWALPDYSHLNTFSDIKGSVVIFHLDLQIYDACDIRFQCFPHWVKKGFAFYFIPENTENIQHGWVLTFWEKH